jgi:hypothetical protein
MPQSPPLTKKQKANMQSSFTTVVLSEELKLMAGKKIREGGPPGYFISFDLTLLPLADLLI